MQNCIPGTANISVSLTASIRRSSGCSISNSIRGLQERLEKPSRRGQIRLLHVWKRSARTIWAGLRAMLLHVRLLHRPPLTRVVCRRHSSIQKRQQCAMPRRLCCPIRLLLVSWGGVVPGLVANTVLSTGAAYVDGVEAQANAMREAAATEILERLNGGLNELSAGVNTLTQTGVKVGAGRQSIDLPLPTQTQENLNRGYVQYSPHDPGIYGRSADDDYGRAALRSDKSLYPDGYADPETDEFARHRALASQQVSKRYLPPDMDGSYDRPITNPQDLMGMDLMHTRVGANHHRNGVVWGGHDPANPTDIDHPLWRINGGPAADNGSAGRLAGLGALGAGALGMRGAARMGAGSFGGSGAGSVTPGTYSGKGFGTYGAPSQAGSGNAAGSGVNGTTATPRVAGASSAQGGASGAGRGSFMGSGMGAGAGGSKDEKKARRRKYQPYRYLDDAPDALPEGYVNPPVSDLRIGQGPGSREARG